MKLGLLICDHVPADYAAWAGSYPDMFRAWLPGLETEVFHVVDDEFPASPEVCDAWLVNGSRHSVYDDIAWIKRLQQFVRDIHQSGKPYLGVCFGHQMLAEALGGKVAKSDKGWCVGTHRFAISKPKPWMHPAQDHLSLLMMCQDQVQVLPPDSEVLASADDCPVGMFVVSGRMLGVQAHPEFTARYDQTLMEARVARIGDKKVQQGIASLSTPANGELFRSWTMQFFAQAGH